MAYTKAPQGNPHGMIRVPATGSPFEIANNTSRIPQTLNYIDCYPVQEKQFGQNPIYQVAAREAFKQLQGFNLANISLATGFNNSGAVANNSGVIGGTPPTTLSGYYITQVGNMMIEDEDDSGSSMFINVVMQTNTPTAAGYTAAAVSLNIIISGVLGTVITIQPSYIYFNTGVTIGISRMGNFNVNVGGNMIASVDPYYVVVSPPPSYTLTVSGNPASYNIFTQAVAAGMVNGAGIITVNIPLGQTVGNIITGVGWVAGSTITINNAGTVLGAGGIGGAGGGTTNGGLGQAGVVGNPAFYLSWPITINNTGLIAGGGGGGGGGDSGGAYSDGYKAFGGAGGGGGAGYPPGGGGAGGIGSTGNGQAGNTGGALAGGNGAIGYNDTGNYYGLGGSTYLQNGGVGSGGSGAGHGFGYVQSASWSGGGGALAGNGGGDAGPAFPGSAPPYYTPIEHSGGLAGNAVQCNGYSVLNIPNGTYTGSSAYGTIYGVIG